MTDEVKMEGVTEYCEGSAVSLVTAGNGRTAIRAWAECENVATDVDLLELLAWVQANRPDLMPASAEIASLTAEVKDLTADRDSWSQQASDRAEDAVRFAAECDRLRSDRDCEKRLRKDAEDRREEFAAEAERLRIGHDRYETVRRMNVSQFQDAFILNKRTGKPFDEIVDHLRPFLRPSAATQPVQPVEHRSILMPPPDAKFVPWR